MKKRLLIIFLATAAMLCSCTGNTVISSFVTDESVRLEIDGARILEFDENNCQLAFNADKCEFRVMTDRMLDYFTVSLDRIPERTGQKAKGTVVWSSPDGEKSRKEITLEAKRIKGDLIWLCDAFGHTACVVRVLE